MKPKINKIGIEIEGEFSKAFRNKLVEYGSIHSDGSLADCGYSHPRHNPAHKLDTWEFVTAPRAAVKEFDGIFDLFSEAYRARDFHYNETCGFHVHVSFAPSFVPQVFWMEFVRFFNARVSARFPREYERRKDNRFCEAEIPEYELYDRKEGEDNRYRMVNLWAAYAKHGTIEVRLFPASTPMQMRRYLAFVVATVRAFLARPAMFSVSASAVDDEYLAVPGEMSCEEAVDLSAREEDYSLTIN